MLVVLDPTLTCTRLMVLQISMQSELLQKKVYIYAWLYRSCCLDTLTWLGKVIRSVMQTICLMDKVVAYLIIMIIWNSLPLDWLVLSLALSELFHLFSTPRLLGVTLQLDGNLPNSGNDQVNVEFLQIICS